MNCRKQWTTKDHGGSQSSSMNRYVWTQRTCWQNALKRPGDSVSLVLRDSNASNSPRALEKYTDFRDREFNEIMEWATTPKFNLDRSVKDQLQERQYG
jgi:hypothetical protein